MEDLAVPRYTVAERDRRWQRLREAMNREGLDGIILPYNTGHWGQFQADAQYVTHMGGNDSEICALFPAKGEVTAWVRSAGYIPFWLAAQKWVTDIRNSRGIWGPGIVERIRELGLEQGRIGVVGLDNLIRAPEGTIPFAMMEHIRSACPEAEFVSATVLLQTVRSVKSAEELGMMAHAAHIAEMAIEAMARTALPGVTDARVYSEVYTTMMRNGGEIPTMVLWCAAPELQGNFYYPTNRPLQAGDLISSELEAKYCGYRAQVTQPVAVSYFKEPYASMLEVSIEAFNRLSAIMVPGTEVGRLWDLCEQMTREHDPYQINLVMHGRGLGEDRPLVTSAPNPEVRALTLEENNAFILKPVVASKEPTRRINWGDTVVVKPGGAQRLGKRPQGIVISREV